MQALLALSEPLQLFAPRVHVSIADVLRAKGARHLDLRVKVIHVVGIYETAPMSFSGPL